MTTLSTPRVVVAAAVAAAALALPAAASAHPSVYVTSAPADCTAPATPYTVAQLLATCTTQTRYVFTNHGNTYLLRESNGKTSGGAISYAHRPAALAAASDFNVFALPPKGPATGAQPHATCDVAALNTPAVIRSWQGVDPFYAYVPFQRTAAGVDDNAATWLPLVQAATGVNLAAVADTDAAREAACEALPGASASSYAPADATQNTLASWSSGQVHLATAPLEEELARKDAQIASLGAGAALGASGTGGAQQIDALQAEIAALKLDLRPLKLTLPSTIPSPGGFAGKGIALRLAGPAKRTVRVRALIGAPQARKLGLRSRVLASRGVALGAGGSAAFTLKPATAAAVRLRKAKGSLVLAVDAATGDRHNLVSATLGR
ncbi:MAG: hypothetical protein QOH83_2199 [Solirubrobacteraceae bacterium]|nr:hypothetical protein [Solirubrobacteraceae bacterium]